MNSFISVNTKEIFNIVIKIVDSYSQGILKKDWKYDLNLTKYMSWGNFLQLDIFVCYIFLFCGERKFVTSRKSDSSPLNSYFCGQKYVQFQNCRSLQKKKCVNLFSMWRMLKKEFIWSKVEHNFAVTLWSDTWRPLVFAKAFPC